MNGDILEIASYELYHIGNKLNPAADINILKYKLKGKLTSIGFTIGFCVVCGV
jgi:hypothetical protein